MKFLTLHSEIWKRKVVEVHFDDSDNVVIWDENSIDCSILDSAKGIDIFVYKDSTMQQFHEDNGYLMNSFGEGPFAILFRERKLIDFVLKEVVEVQADENSPYEIIPYSARLCSNAVHEFTLVTPTDPVSDEYSGKLYSLLIESCTNPK